MIKTGPHRASQHRASAKTKTKIKIGDRVVFATAPAGQTPMRGTVLKLLRAQTRTGGGVANVLVQWDNGHTGKAQDFTLTVVGDGYSHPISKRAPPQRAQSPVRAIVHAIHLAMNTKNCGEDSANPDPVTKEDLSEALAWISKLVVTGEGGGL